MKKIFLLCSVLAMLSLFSSGAFALSFEAAMNFNVGRGPSSVVTGDFNGDGRIDLAVANEGSEDISILLGNGDAAFHTAGTYETGSDGATSIATGDFNGDGRTDLAVANFALDVGVL
ncbi:MAG TPA: VCBS repeat-containing protein, partial [Thermodesulfovibrionales bacterium]|nr:VCBS repeat-containing protein [Thermodesulfovibrionales bacterium]